MCCFVFCIHSPILIIHYLFNYYPQLKRRCLNYIVTLSDPSIEFSIKFEKGCSCFAPGALHPTMCSTTPRSIRIKLTQARWENSSLAHVTLTLPLPYNKLNVGIGFVQTNAPMYNAEKQRSIECFCCLRYGDAAGLFSNPPDGSRTRGAARSHSLYKCDSTASIAAV